MCAFVEYVDYHFYTLFCMYAEYQSCITHIISLLTITVYIMYDMFIKAMNTHQLCITQKSQIVETAYLFSLNYFTVFLFS